MRALKGIRTVALSIGAILLLGVGIASASGTSDGTGIIRATVVDKTTNLTLNNLCVTAINHADPTITGSVQGTSVYWVTELPPGTYDLQAQSCPGAIAAYATGTADVLHGVVVTADQVTQAPPIKVTRVASPFPYGSIAGAVADANTGAPLPGICVTGPVSADPTVARPTTVSDANGRYRFDNVLPLSNAEAEFRDCPNSPQSHKATSVHMVVAFGPIVTNMPAALMETNGGTPPPAKPATPTNVQASRPRRSTTATVTWVEAAGGGTAGGTATSFVVTAYPAGRKTAFTSVTVGGTLRSANVGGLHVGNRYVFTVTAVNTAGSSAPSAPSNRA